MKTKVYAIILIFIITLCASYSNAQPRKQIPKGGPGWDKPQFPPIQKTSPGVFRIGEIQIHKKAMSVTFPAFINMDKGLIEYLLVTSTGKTHESLLRTEIEPYLLNIAFLLLGFEGTNEPLVEQGAKGIPKGEKVEISVIHRIQEKSVAIPVEKWIAQKIGKDMRSPIITWIYTGSTVMQGRFLAQEQGSIAAVYHDPASLIDHATEGGESDEIWFVREGIVPPAGTPVTVVIRKVKE